MLSTNGGVLPQVNLGQMYTEGDGVPTDVVEGLRWYTMAADRGHVVGMQNLGWIYM